MKRKSRESLKIYGSIGAAVAAGIIIALLFYQSLVLEVRNIPMDIEVGSTVGINLDTDAIHFGRTFPGGSANRYVKVNHSYPWPVRFTLVSEGQLGQWVAVSSNMFILPPDEDKQVEITANVPWGTEHGTYQGYLRIILQKE